MKKQVIKAEFVKSNNSDKMVWHVFVTESENTEQQGWCKTAYSALQYCFILKKQTGAVIDGSTLKMLKAYYAENEREARWAKINAQKEAEAAAASEGEGAQEQVAQAPAEQTEVAQPKRRGRKAKKMEVAE